jgi:hypothetical protein
MTTRASAGFATWLVAALLLPACGDGGGAGSSSETDSQAIALGAPADVMGTAAKSPYGQVKMRLVVDAEQGAIKDLKDFNLTPEERTGTPYYVHQKLTNLDKPVSGGAGVASLDAFDDTGGETKSLTLLGTFPACEARSAPDEFATGASFEDCTVYLAPKGRKLTRLVHHETRFDGPDLEYTWKVP